MNKRLRGSRKRESEESRWRRENSITSGVGEGGRGEEGSRVGKFDENETDTRDTAARRREGRTDGWTGEAVGLVGRCDKTEISLNKTEPL